MPTYMQLGLPLLDNGAMEVSSLIRYGETNFVALADYVRQLLVFRSYSGNLEKGI
jgi:hypothetical protein